MNRRNQLTLSNLKEIEEKCPVMGIDRINKDVPKKTDEWWNMVSLLFLTTFGILREELWGEVFERNTDKEVKRFGNKAVQAVNSIIAEKHPRSLLGVCAVDGLQTNVNLRFDNGESVTTSLDLWGVRRENGKETPVVTKFKFAPAVSKDKDIESLTQALAVVYNLYSKEPFEVGTLPYEDFPEKVLVYRISLENRVTQILVYTKQELWDGQEIVKAAVSNALSLINHEKEAKHIPGEHCLKCPFLLTCSMSEFEPKTVEEHYKKAIFHKELAKFHENEVKTYAKTLANEDVERVLDNKTEVIVPLSDKEDSFGAIQVSQTETIVKSRKKDAPTNRDILKLLIEDGLIAGEEDDVTEPKITLNKQLVDIILQEVPEWKEYFKSSVKITTKLLTPKEVSKKEKEDE